MELLRCVSTRLDAYVLFPDDMALRRLLGYDPTVLESYAPSLTKFFGSEAWRSCLDARVTSEQRDQHMPKLAQLYLSQLRALGWPHAEVVRKIRLRGEQGLYSMLFVTANAAAMRLVKWEQDTVDPQHSLFAS